MACPGDFAIEEAARFVFVNRDKLAKPIRPYALVLLERVFRMHFGNDEVAWAEWLKRRPSLGLKNGAEVRK